MRRMRLFIELDVDTNGLAITERELGEQLRLDLRFAAKKIQSPFLMVKKVEVVYIPELIKR